jgi:hypothetical protein
MLNTIELGLDGYMSRKGKMRNEKNQLVLRFKDRISYAILFLLKKIHLE